MDTRRRWKTHRRGFFWGASSALVLVLFQVPSTQARTWQVDRDGSGDFTILQDAIDASAAGDSVLVGPGRYGDLRQQVVTGGTVYSILHPKVRDLTVIGSGTGVTILGPDPEELVINNVATVCVWVDYGITGLEVSGMTMENTWALMQLSEGAVFVDCEFLFQVTGNATTGNAVRLVQTDGCRFERCDFVVERLETNAIGSFVGSTNRNMQVIDCNFTHIGPGAASMLLEVADNLLVRNCRFQGAFVAIVILAGVDFRIEDCVFRDQQSLGVVAETRELEPTTGRIDRCRFEGQRPGALLAGSRSVIEGEGNVFGPSSFATIGTFGPVDLRLHNNHILHGTGLSVFVESHASRSHIDLTNNYWGTTDSTQIAEWIDDGNDPCENVGVTFCPRAVVEFAPFLGQQVPVQSSSVGELKGAYGGRR